MQYPASKQSKFLVCPNRRNWFQIKHWPQNRPWNHFGEKEAVKGFLTNTAAHQQGEIKAVFITFSAAVWKFRASSSLCCLSSELTENCFHTRLSRGRVSPEERVVQRSDWQRTTVACSS